MEKLLKRTGKLLSLLLLGSGCTGSSPYTEQRPIRNPEIVEAIEESRRPEHCELYAAGEFRIRTGPNGALPKDLESRIRSLGYHAWRDIEQETVMERGAWGLRERVVAMTGTGLKWNDPGCDIRG